VDPLPELAPALGVVLLGAGAGVELDDAVVPVNLGTITVNNIITMISTTRAITPYLIYVLVCSSRVNSLGLSLIDFYLI
jgi:hypothetical protein